MKRFPRLAYGGLAAAVGLAVLSIHLVAASGNAARSGRVRVVRGALAPPGPEIHGDAFARPGRAALRLARPASAPLIGMQAPVGGISPDGTQLAYNSFRVTRPVDGARALSDQGISRGDELGVPTLRIRDLRGGDTPLEPGSQSFAWRADGALAYAVGDPPAFRANVPFTTNVYVRRSVDDAPEQWTTSPDEYTVLAWAGSTLIVQRDVPGGGPAILALDGPGRARTLAESGSFIAASPDGAVVAIAEAPADTPHPHVRLIRVADGTEVASLSFADARDPVTNDPEAWIAGPGSWSEDRLVAPAETGLVVLRAGGGLAVDQVLHVDSATQPDSSLFEPRFVGDGTQSIVAWSGVPGTEPHKQAAQILCDRFALQCTRGAAVEPLGVPRPVYDLSGGVR